MLFIDKFRELFEQPLYVPYFWDLPPYDVSLSQWLNWTMKGPHYDDIQAIKTAGTELCSIPENSFQSYFTDIKICGQQCIIAGREYFVWDR